MQRIDALNPATLAGRARQLTQQVQSALGMVPNMMATMAHSPAALEGYLRFNAALGGGVLPAKLREQLALLVGNTNSCDYCVAAHATLGSAAGLQPGEIHDTLAGISSDPASKAALTFARRVLEQRGQVTDNDLDRVRAAGWDEAAVVEIVAHVALNIFTNYFNQVAQTEIDFPKLEPIPA